MSFPIMSRVFKSFFVAFRGFAYSEFLWNEKGLVLRKRVLGLSNFEKSINHLKPYRLFFNLRLVEISWTRTLSDFTVSDAY